MDSLRYGKHDSWGYEVFKIFMGFLFFLVCSTMGETSGSLMSKAAKPSA